MTDRKLLTHRPFRIWHCLCARDRYGGMHSSSAGSRVSELTDTPNLASSYCPRCEPERDPVREILTVCWCDEHRPTCEGADDERAIVGGGVLDSAGEVAWVETYRALLGIGGAVGFAAAPVRVLRG